MSEVLRQVFELERAARRVVDALLGWQNLDHRSLEESERSFARSVLPAVLALSKLVNCGARPSRPPYGAGGTPALHAPAEVQP